MNRQGRDAQFWPGCFRVGTSVPDGHCCVPVPRQSTGEVLQSDMVPAASRPSAPCRYDDYDYAEVNQLLERVLKVYIKTVTCYPEKTNSEMFDRFWKQFKHSEKVGRSFQARWAEAAG